MRENHKFGISENTKKLIKERDHVRANLSKLEPREKAIQHIKYKKLRNRINSLVKSDTIKYNNTRVEQAKDENELWKIVKEITKPKEENKWSLKEENEIITDEADIAEIFNTFFIQKIQDIKENIDQSQAQDPTTKLKEDLKDKNLKFSLRQVSEEKVLRTIKSMKSKRSSGADELSQEQMILGAEEIVKPLTIIINRSISEGIFPESWKKAIVTPVLKKEVPKKKVIIDL